MTTMKTKSPTRHVVLLHGWGGSAQSVWFSNGWHAVLQDAGLAPLGIDILGHGAAAQPHDPQQYGDLAAGVIAQLPDSASGLLGLGYSLGCKLLLEIEARQPGRFARLVLGGLGGNVFAPEKGGDLVADYLEHGARDDTPASVKALAAYGVANGNDPLAIAAALRRTPNPVLTAERLRDVRCPVLLVCGDADRIAFPVQPLADALPNCSVSVLPGVDHLHLPQESEFMRQATNFLTVTSNA